MTYDQVLLFLLSLMIFIHSLTNISHYKQFCWRPYLDFHYSNEEESQIWSANTYLICFEVVERHQTDRVMLQFGLPQFPPAMPDDLRNLHETCCHKIKIKGSWGDHHQYYILKWNQRHQFALHGVRYTYVVYPNRIYFQWYWNFFGERLYLSREALLANPMARSGITLQGLPANYPAAPEPNMMPDEDMWSDTHPPNSQFITPSLPYFDTSFNSSTNYNFSQTYQSPPQPTNEFLQHSPIPYPTYSQHSHHGESSQISNYSFDDFNPTQNTPQTSFPHQSEYSPFNLPTPPNNVHYPETTYAPQWPEPHISSIENLAAGFNEDDFVNEMWTHSVPQVQNDVTMETNDAEIQNVAVEEEQQEEEEEQDQRPVRRKKDKLCATGSHNLNLGWRKWLPRRK